MGYEKEVIMKKFLSATVFVGLLFANGDVSGDSSSLTSVKNAKTSSPETHQKAGKSQGSEKQRVEGTELTDRCKRRLDKQSGLLEKHEGSKNYLELQKLTESDITITKSSYKGLDKDFGHAVIKVDLFEPDNLRNVLWRALDFVLNKNAKSNFIMGEYSLRNNIEKNQELQQSVVQLKSKLLGMNVTNNDSQIEVIKSLQRIYDLAVSDKNIGCSDPFAKFIYGIQQVYQVMVLRRVADAIMEKSREVTEKSLNETVKTLDVSVGAEGEFMGLHLGGSVSIHNEEGADDSSFYTISAGKEVEFKVGSGFFRDIVSVDGAVSASVTKEAVFYSLEQLFDSGKFKGGLLEAEEVKKIRDSREQMQQRERELLAIFGGFVESYLKIVSVIPVRVYIEWPIITKASAEGHATTISGAISGTLSLFDSCGFTIKATQDRKTYQRSMGYLTLLSDDCSPADGYVVDDISAFIGTNYDFSEEYLEKIFLSGKASSKTTKGSSKEKFSGRIPKALEVALASIIGDLRKYNDTLSSLAELSVDKEQVEVQLQKLNSHKAKSRKEVKAEIKKLEDQEKELNKHVDELEKSKADMENRWKGKWIREGREGMLKSMMVTLTCLREWAENQREIELFKQAYVELCKLEKLHEFSKNEKKRRASFVSQKVDYNSAITGTLELPYNASIEFTRSHYGDDPFQENKGTDFEINFTLPLTAVGVIGKEILQKKLEDISKKLEGGQKDGGEVSQTDAEKVEKTHETNDKSDESKKKHSKSHHKSKKGRKRARSSSEDFSGAFQLAGDGFIELCKHSAIPVLSNIVGQNPLGSSVFTIGLTKVDPSEASRALPGEKEIIIRDKDKWAMQYLQIMSVTNLGISIDVKAVNAEVNAAIGKRKRIIGSDTLSYITSKYDAWALGLKDKKGASSKVNTPWEALKKEQAGQLKKLFINIADKNSGARYELQCMYNDTLDNLEEMEAPSEVTQKSKECEESFKKLLEKSKELQTGGSTSELYANALSAFDEVLKLNHKYNFLKEYEESYRIDNKK